MRFLFLIGFFTLIQFVPQAQTHTNGQVSVIQDDLVDSVLRHYEDMRLKIMENPDNKAIPGFRIQIFFDSGINSSDRARQIKDEFMLKYPGLPAYVNWKSPNYRVRVGDFKTRLEAEKALQQVKIDYPNAWVIKDEINFPEMN